MSDQPSSPWERLARRFHEVYEELAPKFEWETQIRSRVQWDALPASQKRLMIETVATVVPEYVRSEKGTSAATHWKGCGKEGGPRHYECLLRDYEALERELRSAQSATGARTYKCSGCGAMCLVQEGGATDSRRD